MRGARPGLVLLALAAGGVAGASDPAEPIQIRRIAVPVQIDGDLSDPVWREAVPVDTWFETNVSDSLPAKMRNVARLAYDDQFFYAAFEFEDPTPAKIRAPFGDRDDVRGYTDYGGVILDTRNDGKTAQMFLANARGIQYDALSSDATGEDSAPDFFWDSAARITERGWNLELRIPFASLRYTGSDPGQWGVLLYRNHPRDFRYQMFTSRLPRDSTCFLCHVRPLVGLAGLPAGAHWVVAPFVTGSQAAFPEGDLGSSLSSEHPEAEAGVDAKWVPNPDTVLDATYNPDFSQIEADAPQITANERFALFYPEKRPFFLESVDLFSTPIQAVYTRTFTSPRFGTRFTGDGEKTKYTVLVGRDRAEGSVIIPGPQGSELAPRDFPSWVAIGRVRRDIGTSSVSFLYSGRENEGGSYNRVAGPDFVWRPTGKDQFSGQLLGSWSETPDRPDLAAEWDGRQLAGYAGKTSWYHQAERWDGYAQVADVADEFRADNGFVPQVGYRGAFSEWGRTFRPQEKPVSRLRLFTYGEYNEDQNGELLNQAIVPGFGMDALWNSFVRLELAFDELTNAGRTFQRFQVRPTIQVRPGKVLSEILLYGSIGDDVDFANNRPATGYTANLSAALRPTDHIALTLDGSRRVLDVEPQPGAGEERLLTAEVARLRAVYTFNARSWLRLVGQWTETRADPALFVDPVDDREGAFASSAVFAYKVNWQTLLFLGYGEDRLFDEADAFQPASRQAFLKLSYAFQG